MLMRYIFQVNLWERMAHVGDYRQMPWLPVLVVSGSGHLPALHSLGRDPIGAPSKLHFPSFTSFTSHTSLARFLGLLSLVYMAVK